MYYLTDYNNPYRPNAHLLKILMHFIGNIYTFLHIIITIETNYNYTYPSLGGTPFEQTLITHT